MEAAVAQRVDTLNTEKMTLYFIVVAFVSFSVKYMFSAVFRNAEK